MFQTGRVVVISSALASDDLYSRISIRGQPSFPKGTLVTSALTRLAISDLVLCRLIFALWTRKSLATSRPALLGVC